MKIFHNRFKSINLYRLRHMRGHHYDSLHDQERIGIENGMLRLRKVSGTYKDFGKSFYEIWSENFLNYSSIMVSLFARILELRINHSISLRASRTYHVSFPFHSGDRAPHFQYSCVASNVVRVLTGSAPSIKRHFYSFMYLSHLAPTFMFCDQSCSEHQAPRATLL